MAIVNNFNTAFIVRVLLLNIFTIITTIFTIITEYYYCYYI